MLTKIDFATARYQKIKQNQRSVLERYILENHLILMLLSIMLFNVFYKIKTSNSSTCLLNIHIFSQRVFMLLRQKAVVLMDL